MNSQDSKLLLLRLSREPVIGIFHEYAHVGKGNYIRASGQHGWFKTQVDDCSKIVGGTQCIESLEVYALPLSIHSGLAYLHPIHPHTDTNLDSYPHVVFTPPQEWDPTVLDHAITPELLEDIDSSSDDSLLDDPFFNEFGEMNQ